MGKTDGGIPLLLEPSATQAGEEHLALGLGRCGVAGVDQLAGVAQFFPKPLHVCVDGPVRDGDPVPPNFLEHPFAGQYPPWPLHQGSEEQKFLRGQCDFPLSVEALVALEIDEETVLL